MSFSSLVPSRMSSSQSSGKSGRQVAFTGKSSLEYEEEEEEMKHAAHQLHHAAELAAAREASEHLGHSHPHAPSPLGHELAFHRPGERFQTMMVHISQSMNSMNASEDARKWTIPKPVEYFGLKEKDKGMIYVCGYSVVAYTNGFDFPVGISFPSPPESQNVYARSTSGRYNAMVPANFSSQAVTAVWRDHNFEHIARHAPEVLPSNEEFIRRPGISVMTLEGKEHLLIPADDQTAMSILTEFGTNIEDLAESEILGLAHKIVVKSEFLELLTKYRKAKGNVQRTDVRSFAVEFTRLDGQPWNSFAKTKHARRPSDTLSSKLEHERQITLLLHLAYATHRS